MSRFQGLTASSSDSAMLTASAANTAAAGTYAINVTSLAQSQKLVALGQTSQTTAVGLGGATTLTFGFRALLQAARWPAGHTPVPRTLEWQWHQDRGHRCHE